MVSSLASMVIAFLRSCCTCDHFRRRQFMGNIDSNSTFFKKTLIIWFSCLKTCVDVSWVGVYLRFFSSKKREINDKGEGYLCQAWRNVRGVLRSFVMKRDGRGWVVQKKVILVWRNYWMALVWNRLSTQ